MLGRTESLEVTSEDAFEPVLSFLGFTGGGDGWHSFGREEIGRPAWCEFVNDQALLACRGASPSYSVAGTSGPP